MNKFLEQQESLSKENTYSLSSKEFDDLHTESLMEDILDMEEEAKKITNGSIVELEKLDTPINYQDQRIYASMDLLEGASASREETLEKINIRLDDPSLEEEKEAIDFLENIINEKQEEDILRWLNEVTKKVFSQEAIKDFKSLIPSEEMDFMIKKIASFILEIREKTQIIFISDRDRLRRILSKMAPLKELKCEVEKEIKKLTKKERSFKRKVYDKRYYEKRKTKTSIRKSL